MISFESASRILSSESSDNYFGWDMPDSAGKCYHISSLGKDIENPSEENKFLRCQSFFSDNLTFMG